MRRFLYAVTVAGCLAVNPALAEDKPAPVTYTEVPGPALPLALRLAQGALDACHAKGLSASAAVVDSDGRLKVLLRADGAPKPPVAAPLKAAAAAHFDAPGSDMEPREKTDTAFAAELAAHKDLYNPHAGSLPLHKDGKVFGGFAVADVPHADADACVRAALNAVAPELK
ncbi:heme-binding protein [Asticcacaulis solisilvae]|uniref:heme-binding protein n=1 Tax=Asticcacaulis solisilvae TaxID=1217274 RepID=UPI003FD81733